MEQKWVGKTAEELANTKFSVLKKVELDKNLKLLVKMSVIHKST